MSVYIVLLTYERYEYAEITLRSTLDNVSCSEPLSVHIADDGSSDSHRRNLSEIAGGYAKVKGVTVTNSERGGYGRSYNLALQVVHQHSDIILPIEDDWELVRELNLDPLIAVLREGHFGCIRLGYLGYTQPLRGEFVDVSGTHYLRLLPDSPEPHVWSGHPRIETRDWQKAAGPWPEGFDPGSTEFTMAQNPANREGVAWPIDFIKPRGDLFAHIGAVSLREDREMDIINA